MSVIYKLLLCYILFLGEFSLKLQLVDEDYVVVQIGYPPKEYKLIVDPVGSFTYLFKENGSTSKKMEIYLKNILSQMFLGTSLEFGKMTFST